MDNRVLVLGPSGVGKTYIATFLRDNGVGAYDADLIPGLAGYYNGNGDEVEYPIDAGKEFFDNHEFLWNREFIEKFLETRNEVYLFGISGNAFEMLDLFSKVYFLKASPELLAQRLRHESRENPMGKTDYQLQNALNWAKEIEEEAFALNIPMIDATLKPQQIFDQIRLSVEDK